MRTLRYYTVREFLTEKLCILAGLGRENRVVHYDWQIRDSRDPAPNSFLSDYLRLHSGFCPGDASDVSKILETSRLIELRTWTLGLEYSVLTFNPIYPENRKNWSRIGDNQNAET